MLSVLEMSQLAGSEPAAGHTFARKVVGLVPNTCTRARSGRPAVYVSPGTVAEPSVVSVPAASRVNDTETAPEATILIFAR